MTSFLSVLTLARRFISTEILIAAKSERRKVERFKESEGDDI